MRVYADDYYAVVAESIEEARHFFLAQDLTDEDGVCEVKEVDPCEETMWFPLNELPEKYHDARKYPRKDVFGHYIGVDIPLDVAMRYTKHEVPYIIRVSGDLL